MKNFLSILLLSVICVFCAIGLTACDLLSNTNNSSYNQNYDYVYQPTKTNKPAETTKPVETNNTVVVTSVSLDINNKIVTMDESFVLTVTVLPENATDKTVTWSSSDTSVATVANGTVTAKSQGNTTITVESNNGKTATCTVKVTEPQIAVSAYIDGTLYDTVYTSESAKYKITPPAVEGDINANPNSNKYFYGWFLDSNFQTPLNDDCTFTQNSKIYAKWITVYTNSFQYTVSNGYATITGFSNSTTTVVVVPAYINSFPVSTIGYGSKYVNGRNYNPYGAFQDKTQIRTVIICDGIQTIEKNAFKNCNSMKEITIPNSVTSIGINAFYGCSSLTSVTIGNSVTSIGDHAFYGCSSLTCITIPDSVTSIEYQAFYGCSGLTCITIPDSVTSIGEHAFYRCSGLTSVYYKGNSEQWSNIAIDNFNSHLLSATIYYYSETAPKDGGNYWHYVDNEIVLW